MTKLGSVLTILSLFACVVGNTERDADDPHREPSKCEVCKIFATELQSEFDRTGRSKEVIGVGHQLDKKGDRKKMIKYHTSEMRFIEATDNICDKVLEYNLHAERQGSRRFAKGQSETFETLHGLVDKGVKVDLGIPYDMWDLPSAEITSMKKYCESLMESFEDDIEEWYYHHQSEGSLLTYLCEERALPKAETDQN
ncbi:protein canopy homolog 4-like [Saccoglossus kowalevskii]|uniref:Protein canopy homolog 4-like n=1 Tax=Saccoglossus kowalevskii TaxID=10224 RepID=A0ABM0M3U1_SACKO|nr:PREDICTED: protein canopy homolog 4-like [Saccoglossus kowalevskii]